MSSHRSLFQAAAPAKHPFPMARSLMAAAVALTAAGAAQAQVTGNPTRGQTLWGTTAPPCSLCHDAATPPTNVTYPPLGTLRTMVAANGGGTTANARARIIAGIVQQPLMASYRNAAATNGTTLSDADLNDLAAYMFPPSGTPAPAPTPTPTPAPPPPPPPPPPAGTPVVSATPSIIGFPATSLGNISALQEIVVTNATASTVQFAGAAVTLMPVPGTNTPPVGADNFQLANAAAGPSATCQNNGMLGAGASCRVGVLFRPMGTAGFRSADWSVNFTNATAARVTLSGSATPAPAPAPTPAPAPSSANKSGTDALGAGGGAISPLGVLASMVGLSAAAALRGRRRD